MTRMVITFWLLLICFAYAEKPDGAPVSTEAEKNFFNGAMANGVSCCSESDGYREGINYPERLNANYPHPGGVILRDWVASKDVPGGYRVNVIGIWQDIAPDLVVKSPPSPPNITGGAVIWVTFVFESQMNGTEFKMTNNVRSMTIRCFVPGNQF